MRFLIDSCAGRVLAEWLRDQGHDVARVRDRGRDPGDVAILGWAVAEARILVTMDKDFGALIYRERLQHAGLIRLPRCTIAERKVLLGDVLARHADELQGAIVTIRGDRIRLSSARPPEEED